MADFNKLKDTIRGAIYPNGRGAISADKHQAALLDMADTMQETAAQVTELSEEINGMEIPFPNVAWVETPFPRVLKKGEVITAIKGAENIVAVPSDGSGNFYIEASATPFVIPNDLVAFYATTAGEGAILLEGGLKDKLPKLENEIQNLQTRTEQIEESVNEVSEEIKGIQNDSILETDESISIVDDANEIIAHITKDGVFARKITLQNGDNTMDVAKEINELSTKGEKIKEESAKNVDSAFEVTNDDETEVYVRLCEKGVFARGFFDMEGNPLGLDTAYKGRYWAVCGDSITNANHPYVDDIEEGDSAMPMDGYSQVSTYKRKNYAYYIAKNTGIKWANYGWGGTTLHHCAPKAYVGNMEYAPFVDWRIEQLKEGIEWDYISLFFGWNDCAFGPIYQRDLWLKETYGVELGYPIEASQIGANGFANAEQKAACDNAVGSFNGVDYTNSKDYFFAKFVGTINDTSKDTWYGAWNYALDYLMKKYPSSKIVIVAPYLPSAYNQQIRESIQAIAKKWGVVFFDFENLPYWYYKSEPNHHLFKNPNDDIGYWYTIGGNSCEPTIEGYNQARLSTDTLHPSNLGYKMLSSAFEKTLLNK